MTEQSQERLRRIYACLNALKGDGGDVLIPLAYFFEDFFGISSGKAFSKQRLVTFSREVLGWPITDDIAEDFVPHFEKLGWIERVGAGHPAVYAVVHKPSDQSRHGSATTELLGRIEASLTQYFQSHAPSFLEKKSGYDLVESFLSWLMTFKINREGLDLSTLEHSSTEGLVLSAEDEAADEEEVPDGGLDGYSMDYFFARYVQDTFSDGSELSDALSSLWAVGMLMEVVDEIAKPATRGQKSQQRVIIDAPVALTYLGLSGKRAQEAVALVLDSLRAIGCTICAFEISCAEINRSLDSLLSNDPRDRFGPTADALRRGEVLLQQVEYVRSHPDTALSRANVSLLSHRLETHPTLSTFFDRRHYEDFLAEVRWGETKEAKEHDAEALTLTMRLRQGRHSSEPFSNSYVFVTQNPTFFRVSRKYLVTSQLVSSHHFPPVITTRRLATLAWLQTGLSVAESKIPRGLLLNVCARITATRRNVLDQAKKDIAVLSPEERERFDALALHSRSAQVMMDYYESRPPTEDHADPAELLKLMQNAIAEEHQARADAAIGEIRQNAATMLQSATESMSKAEAERDEERRRADALERQVAQPIVLRYDLASRGTRYALVLLVGTALFVGTTLPSTFPDAVRNFGWLIALIGSVACFYFTVFSPVAPGLNLRIARAFATWAERAVRRNLPASQTARRVVVDEGSGRLRLE